MLKQWLCEGLVFWLWLAALLATAAIAHFLPNWMLPRPALTSDRLRWAGMLYQLYGIGAVIIGLNGVAVLLAAGCRAPKE
jgi:hypothetical protein